MPKNRGGQPRGAAPFLWVLAALVFLGQVAVATLWLRRRFIAVTVSGESMSPALRDGDFLVVDQHAYSAATPIPGDLVLLVDPRSPDRELLKRVIHVDPALGYWVEGDNPAASTDSRVFGWVRDDAIIGRVVLRYWPGSPRLYRRSRSASRTSASSTSPSVGNASAGGFAGSK